MSAILSVPLRRTWNRSQVHAVKCMGVWGVANLTLFIVLAFIPGTWKYLAPIIMIHQLSCLSWMLIAGLAMKVPVRGNLVIALCLILQLWSVFTSLHGNQVMGEAIGAPPLGLQMSEALFLWYALAFIHGMMMTRLVPGFRNLAVMCVLGVLGISAAVAYLQFLGVGWALNLQVSIIGSNGFSFKDFDGVRASGLTGHPATAALQGIVCCCLLASVLAVRRMKPWEIAAFLFFMGEVVVAQARAVYLAGAVLVVVFAFGMLVRSPRTMGALAVAGLLLLAPFSGMLENKLAYGLSKDKSSQGTFDFRRDVTWQQARNVYHDWPYTGLGPQFSLATYSTIGIDKYTGRGGIDNGYYLALAWWGLPGLVMLIGLLFVGLASAIRIMANRSWPPEAKRFAVFGALICVCYGINMFFDNLLTQNGIQSAVFFLAAFAVVGGVRKTFPQTL